MDDQDRNDQIENVSDLFAEPEAEELFEDVEDIEELFEEEPGQTTIGFQGPTAFVSLAGRMPIQVAVAEGDTVADVLHSANVQIDPVRQSVWIDGQPAGLDTPVRDGVNISAIGNAKGG